MKRTTSVKHQKLHHITQSLLPLNTLPAKRRCVEALLKTSLECPRCHWILRVQQPNSQHFAWSFQKPLQANITGDVVEKKFVCRNPKCKRSI